MTPIRVGARDFGVVIVTTNTAPDMHDVHAAIAAAIEVVAERRSLYRLAAEMVGVSGAVPDEVLDRPLVRHRLGEALAGRDSLDGADLSADAIGVVVDAGLPVVADPCAQAALATVLGIVGPVAGLRLLTKADDSFDATLKTVAAGVRLVREDGGGLAEDLLTHVNLLAVVDPATAGGLVSASSRYFPGLVIIERPSTAIEVAEALIHEGAHEKFFDLAITRSFLGVKSDAAEEFVTSWSGARWPIEQVFAAWHAYRCLAQFAESVRAPLGPGSLLPLAGERAAEIAKWLQAHKESLLSDAWWMLTAASSSPDSTSCGILPPRPIGLNGCYATNPLVRMGDRSPTMRRVVGRMESPPLLFWLEHDPATVLDLLSGQADGMSVDDGVTAVRALWDVDAEVARERWSVALATLLEAQLVESTG
jgi:hypothetical protein